MVEINLTDDSTNRIFGNIEILQAQNCLSIKVIDFIEKSSSNEVIEKIIRYASKFKTSSILIDLRESDYIPPFIESSYLKKLIVSYNIAIISNDIEEHQALENSLKEEGHNEVLITKNQSRANAWVSKLNRAFA